MRNPPSRLGKPSQLFQPHLFSRPSLYGVFTILSKNKKRKRKKEPRHKKNGSSTIGISFSLFFSEAHIKHLGMASKYARILGLLDLLVMMLLMSASADLAKDRQECTNQLVGLATCLPYVQGEGKAPTLDCCTGLKQVLQKSKKCLCVLIKDRDDPNLGFKINTTLALSLPTACNTPANMSECPALLQLPPGSPDAKIFEESGNSTSTTKSTPVASAKANSTSSGSSSEMRSGGWRRRRWVGVELVFGLLFLIVSHLLLSSL